MILNEEQIIEGCIKKKRRARKELFERYHKRLRGVCLRYCSSKDEAEDVLLMGFLNILKKIESYNGKGSFEGWMRRIIINTAIDNYRKNKKHYDYSELEEVDIESIPSLITGFPDNLSTQDILALVQNLPHGYRVVFNLFAIEGYSHSEIGKMLGISANTSKTQLHKARIILQEQLKEKID